MITKERSDDSDFLNDHTMEILNNRSQHVFGKNYEDLDGKKKKYIKYIMNPEEHGIEEAFEQDEPSESSHIVEFTNDIYYNKESGEYHALTDNEPLTSEDVFVFAKGETYEYVPEENNFFVRQPMRDTNSESKFDNSDLAEFEIWTKQI